MTIDHRRPGAEVSGSSQTPGEIEVLIKEARQHQRRRYFALAVTFLVLVMAGALVVLLMHPPDRTIPTSKGMSGHSPSSLADSSPKASTPTHSPDLIQPTTLATESNGDLLILDSSRDQILRLTPSGDLSVFAGDGREGDSGDGGLARNSELGFTYFTDAGMAVAPGGTVYFNDTGACRVRTVSPRGIIGTVAVVPKVSIYQSGTACALQGLAISPEGVVYVSTSSDIDRVTPQGKLAWVAGAKPGIASDPSKLTASNVQLEPESIAFDGAGELDIANFSPKVIYQLSPSGTVKDLGSEYAIQLTETDNGDVLSGTQSGLVSKITASRFFSYRRVRPAKVSGLNWGPKGFQEDGIAVTRSGDIYVDNANGNGYGLGTVLVKIEPNGKEQVVRIHSALADTLPAVGSHDFSVSLYPKATPAHASGFASCPSTAGLEPFSAPAVAGAKRVAKMYHSGQFATDLPLTDRSWWAGDYHLFTNGDLLGAHRVLGVQVAAQSSLASKIGSACGRQLVNDSIAIRIGKSGYSDFTGFLYFLDRDGHPLVYDEAVKRIAS
jgi:hypothetical protein